MAKLSWELQIWLVAFGKRMSNLKWKNASEQKKGTPWYEINRAGGIEIS